MASVDPNIKQIKIVPSQGEKEESSLAAAAIKRGGGSRKARRPAGGSVEPKEGRQRTLTISKEGGGMSPGTAVQLAATHVPGGAVVSNTGKPVVGLNSSLTQKGAPVLLEGGLLKAKARGGAPDVAATNTNLPVKVVLEKPATAAAGTANNQPAPKVILGPKNKTPSSVNITKGGSKSSRTPSLAITPAHTKTRKVSSRKIKVSMKTLRKKIHRAKTIRKQAESTTLDEIKKDLHKAGIIKADSKAPEPILRQMYADFMTLKNKAL
jgi:hypothetical protein